MPDSVNAKELAALADSVARSKRETELAEKEAALAARLASEREETLALKSHQKEMLEKASLDLETMIPDLPQRLRARAQLGDRSLGDWLVYKCWEFEHPLIGAVCQTPGAQALQEYCDREGLVLDLSASFSRTPRPGDKYLNVHIEISF